MTHRIAINGYGRIGRNVLRGLYETGRERDLQLVAVNDLGEPAINAHLTRHDSVHGRFAASVELDGHDLCVNGDRIRLLSERDPGQLPWAELGIDAVLECTGLFTSRDAAARHIDAGAGRVLISAPARGAVDATIVFGVNHSVLRSDHVVVSNASCTTNCLAPLVQALHGGIGVVRGLMNTIHSYTNDQVLSDVQHADPRRARSATQSMIPARTGAAAALGLVLPELDGRLDGFAVRVPTINVSLVDLTFEAARDTSVDEVNAVIRAAAEGSLASVLAVEDEPLVSIDFNHHPASSIHDPSMTRVQDRRLVKVCAWYDNEWGFSLRMLDTVQAMLASRAG